jgi:hypothetical protein
MLETSRRNLWVHRNTLKEIAKELRKHLKINKNKKMQHSTTYGTQ